MKKLLLILAGLIITAGLFAQATYFGPNYLHLNSGSNTTYNWTVLDGTIIGTDTASRILFNHVWGVPDGSHEAYMIHSNGLWYTGSEWSIFDEKWTSNLDTNLAYNVLNPISNGTAFRYTVSPANTYYNYSLIDHPLLNGHPDAVFFISKTWDYEVYDTAHVGVWYSTYYNKWTVYNEDGITPLTPYLTFHIFIPDSGTSFFKHTATSTSYVSTITNPLLDGNPYAKIFFVHDFTNNVTTEGYVNDEIGAWYDGNNWTIYTENITPLFVGATFNVLVVADFPLGQQNITQEDQEMKIFPNPASSIVNILVNKNLTGELREVFITGTDGRTLLNSSLAGLNKRPVTLDVSTIPSGLYILTLVTSEGKFTKKLSIVR